MSVRVKSNQKDSYWGLDDSSNVIKHCANLLHKCQMKILLKACKKTFQGLLLIAILYNNDVIFLLVMIVNVLALLMVQKTQAYLY